MKLFKKNLLKILAAALFCVSMGAATAGTIEVDAGWYGFCFGDAPGAPAGAGCGNTIGIDSSGNPFTFSLAGQGLLKVTDAYTPGDIFDVYVDAVLAFTTSAPVDGPDLSDPDLAFASGTFSAGSWLLGAGDHSVSIFLNSTSIPGGGGAFMEVESVGSTDPASVPEPGSLALVGLALLGLAAVRRHEA